MVALSRAEFAPYLEQTPKWGISDQDRKLEREFEFENFEEALKFVNAVGEIAEYEGHHPNIYLHSWNKVKLILYTHAIGGLSDNDFVLAAKIDDI
jgi:4a-hydroxytetrahydrobiopterin dehydratase